MSAGPAVLVLLDQKKHQDLVEDARQSLKRKAARERSLERHLRRRRTGSSLTDQEVIEENAALAKDILNSAHLKHGVFKVRVVEHDKKMAASYAEAGSYRPKVKVDRTVHQVP